MRPSGSSIIFSILLLGWCPRVTPSRAQSARTIVDGPGTACRDPRSLRHAAFPRARACTSAVVRALPPIPQSPLSTLDHAPSDLAHVLALDRDHRIGQLADDLALLFLAEHVFDDANLNERDSSEARNTAMLAMSSGSISP